LKILREVLSTLHRNVGL